MTRALALVMLRSLAEILVTTASALLSGLLTAILVLAIILLLAGCGGTFLDYTGELCGSSQPAMLKLADRKDRSAFEAVCSRTTYDAAGNAVRRDEVRITTSESSASAVIGAQADALGKLAGAIAAGISPASIGVVAR